MRGTSSGWIHRATLLLLCLGLATAAAAQNPLLSPQPIWTTGTSEHTSDIAVGDVDLDGDLDLVRANFDDPASLYLNDKGTLQASPVWTSDASAAAASAALGDVNGDGAPDLVLATRTDVAIFHAQRDPPYFPVAPNVRIALAGAADDIALVDADADGDLDLVMGGVQGSRLLRNDRGFGHDPVWSVPEGAARLAVGDVDADGDPDLVISNVGTDLRLYRGTGSSFETTPAWTLPDGGTAGVALGDLDADGDLDLAASGFMFSETRCYENLGDTFANAAAVVFAGEDSTLAVVLGDADSDGDLDLVCANSDWSRAYRNPGGFATAWTPLWQSSVTRSEQAAWADIDGDGDRDLLVARGPIDLHANLSRLFLTTPLTPLIDGTPLILGDVDRDGDTDLVTSRPGIGASLHLRTDGQFETTPAWVSDGEVTDGALGDVNSDGNPDLVFAGSAGLAVYLQGDSLFAPLPDWDLAVEASTLQLGDVDADGDLDLVTGATGLAYYANRAGGFADVADWTGGDTRIVNVDLADVNGDGRLDIAAAGQPNTTLHLFREGAFETDPVWTSETSTRVAFGDLDGDGRVDLVAARIGLSAAYRNVGGLLEPNPFWTVPAARVHNDVAVVDADADGDLDLLMLDGVGNASELYRNERGVFAAPSPLPTQAADGWQVADVDADGDVDIVAGREQGPIVIDPGARSPAFRGDPTAPVDQRPGNEPFVRDVRLAVEGDNLLRVDFTAIDVEADSVWIIAEYQPKGRQTWDLVDSFAGRGRIGPFTTSPSGVQHSFDWDVSRLPSTGLPLALRLRVTPFRSRLGESQLVASYLHDVGRVVVRRAEIEVSPTQLTLPAITAGDTTFALITIRNRGNEPLQLSRFEFENTVMMRTNPEAPLEIGPGNRAEVFVFYEPTASEPTVPPGEPVYMFIHSNDPALARTTVQIDARALDLEVRARALLPGRAAPLGEPIVVQAIPLPFVHVERAMLIHQPEPLTDTLGVTEWDSVAMTPLGGSFIGTIPGDQVTEVGLRFFVRVENSGVITTDPPGAPEDSIFQQGVERPATFVTTPQPTSRSDFLVGRDINVDVTLPIGAEFVQGTLHYRQGGDTEYLEEPVLVDFLQGIIRGTIPAAQVGPRGLEFWVGVRTLVADLVNPDNWPVSPDTIRTLVPSLQEPQVHPGERYRLLSVPLDFSLEPNRTLDEMLSDEPEFGSYDPMRWRAFRYLPGSGNVERRLDDPAFEVEPGRAFWLVSRVDHQIDPAPVDGLSVSTSRPFACVVEPGWNAVGHPFAFPVDWDAVAKPAAVEPPVAFDPRRGSAGEYVPEPVIRLVPFEGYFVWNGSAGAETLFVPPVAAVTDSGAPARSKARIAALDTWIDITARSSAAADGANRAGIDARAQDELDALDLHEPPVPPGAWVSAAFVTEKPEHRLRQDVRSPSPEGRAWTIELRSSTAGEEVVVDLLAHGAWPADWTLALVDLEQGSIVSLPAGRRPEDGWPSALAVLSHGPDRPYRLRLLAGRADWLSRAGRESVNAPPRVLLFQNAPNPFNASTRIRFGLPQAARAQLEIYDVRGRRVASLVDRDLDAGWHSILWNGRDTQGKPVASGVYLYRLRTPETTLTRRLMLLE